MSRLLDRIEVRVGQDLPPTVEPHERREPRRFDGLDRVLTDLFGHRDRPANGEAVPRLKRDDLVAEGEFVDDCGFREVARSVGTAAVGPFDLEVRGEEGGDLVRVLVVERGEPSGDELASGRDPDASTRRVQLAYDRGTAAPAIRERHRATRSHATTTDCDHGECRRGRSGNGAPRHPRRATVRATRCTSLARDRTTVESGRVTHVPSSVCRGSLTHPDGCAVAPLGHRRFADADPGGSSACSRHRTMISRRGVDGAARMRRS